ncbi:MAG TPA: hypothetical protein VFB84_11250 [Micromonosporaceae bacterium]|nr:hypothetical protein [Micromonosporaceae bacterium]
MVTELRVHGVSGGSAESVLDRPLLRRVAGDGSAGFHAPHPAYPAQPGPGGARLEAYRWGALTAGAAARALWLLLLPFMLANLTMWLRPPAGAGPTRLMRALARIVALSVTATFVLSVVGVSMDLVGWQCTVPGSRCVADRPYLAVLTGLSLGQRLALTSLVPMLVVGLLWFLARRTWTRYEGYPAPPTGAGDGLAHPCFWNGRSLVGRLRAVHIAAAFGVICAVLLGVVVPRDRSTAGPAGWLAPAGLALAAATAALLLACLLVLCLNQFVDRDSPARWAEGAMAGLRTVALLLTAMTLGYAAWPRPDWSPTGGLPGYGSTVIAVFAAQGGLLAVFGLVCLVLRRRGAALLGLAGPIVGSLAVGLSAAFSAGLSYRVADFLDRDDKPSLPEPSGAPPATASTLDPPASYEWAALGFLLLVAVVAVVALVGRASVVRRLRAEAAKVTDADFPGRRADDPGRAAAIDVAVAKARLTNRIGPLVGLAYVPLALVAAVMTGLALAGLRPVEETATRSWPAGLLSGGITLGTYLIGLTILGLVVLGVLAYRYENVRRVVGVAWDLGTFWPRGAHPLAPPCYAERVVPELVKRTSFLAGQGGVVLSGHSQGSVLVAATALQLPPQWRRRTALVTYGSPLARLYASFFPAFVDAGVLAEVGGAVTAPGQPPRWVNLWRDTDPIGGPVQVAGVDQRLRDPAGFDIPPGDTVHPAVAGHSGYPDEDEFDAVVARLAERVRQAPPATAEPAPAGPAAAEPAAAELRAAASGATEPAAGEPGHRRGQAAAR